MKAKHSVKVGKETVPIDIIESEEATQYRLEMGIERRLRVIVPEKGNKDIDEVVAEKKDWIRKKYEKFNDLYSKAPERNFEEGENFLYLGNDYQLKIKQNSSNSNSVEISEGNIVVYTNSGSKEEIKKTLRDWYKDKANRMIRHLVNEYSQKLDIDYNTISLKNQKTRWGSSSRKKNLNFNWRLLMAPKEVIEYMVVHELVHLEENKHTKRFWKKVQEICPDYKEKDEWLRKNSTRLVFTREDL